MSLLTSCVNSRHCRGEVACWFSPHRCGAGEYDQRVYEGYWEAQFIAGNHNLILQGSLLYLTIIVWFYNIVHSS